MKSFTPARRSARALGSAILGVVLLCGFVVSAAPASAAATQTALATAPRDAIDAEFLRLINAARASEGIAPVASAGGLRNLSVWWSTQMADGGGGCALRHNPNAWNQLPQYGASSRTAWAENVAYWSTDRYSVQNIFDRYMASSGHRANIMNARYRYVGVGTVSANTGPCINRDYNTMTFTDRVDNPQPSTPQPSTRVALRSLANGQYVTAENGGNSALIANRSAVLGWETFELINLGGNERALRSLTNNLYVCAEAQGNQPLIANRSAALGWETFELITNGDGTVSLRARANGRFVTAENGGASPLVANRDVILGWEKFFLVQL
jgi:uncharacterized protein YkwD